VLLAPLAAAVISACGGSAAGSAIVQAAQRTARAPGYRFAVSLRGVMLGERFAVWGSGWLSQPGARAELEVAFGPSRLREVLAPPALYLREEGLAGGLRPAQRMWLRLDAAVVAYAAGGTLSGLGPGELLALLFASRAARQTGYERLDGVRTIRYRALVDLRRSAGPATSTAGAEATRLAALLERIDGRDVLPVTVWVDRVGRVRRVRVGFSACAAGGRLSEQTTVDYFDFGRQPPVPVPTPAEVTDVTPSVAAAAAAARGQLGHCR
jgi:hypothetical protein